VDWKQRVGILKRRNIGSSRKGRAQWVPSKMKRDVGWGHVGAGLKRIENGGMRLGPFGMQRGEAKKRLQIEKKEKS